jgi:putative transposase
MPSTRIKPISGEIYHLYNRGVEKRSIYKSRVDYVRFIHDLFEFNDTASAPEFKRRHVLDTSNVGYRKPHIQKTKHKIVQVLAFCLMPNHYHLLVRQLQENGLSLFMHKLGAGYTNAFNRKYNRVGPLLQGKYKIKHVHKDAYLQHLICYIHFNPMKFLKTQNELNAYRWSSHSDYLGEDNFGSIIEKDFILKVFGNEKSYRTFSNNWIENRFDATDFISPVIIDYD